MEVHVTFATAPNKLNGAIVFVNLQDVGTTGWDGYGLRLYRTLTSFNWNLYKYTNGAATSLGGWSGGPAQGDRMMLRRVGGQVQAWYYTVANQTWTLKVSANDSTYVDGHIGVKIIDNGYGGVPVLDDFGGTETVEPEEPGALPATPILDHFNRPPEDPLSQSGNWASSDPAGSASGALEVGGVLGRNLDSGGTLRSYRTTDYSGYTEVYFTVAAMPGSGDSLELLLDLREVGSAAWDGYRFRLVDTSTDQFFIDRIDNGVATPIAGPVAWNVNPGERLLGRRLSSTLEFWYEGGQGWSKMLQADGPEYVGGKIGAGIRDKSGAIEDFGGGNIASNESFLRLYSPELRYDALDTFRADSAAEMTDNYTAEYSNTLKVAPDDDFLAQANPALPEDDLSLDYLGLFYPPGGLAQGRAATADDHIDAENNYTADFQRMHANPIYADKIYGRVVPEGGGSTILQYWLFYYFNWHPEITNIGDHEGDWEMVQVELDPSGTPLRAAYSYHNSGETCDWSSVETTATGAPVVYVARGSHASYFRPGFKPGSQVGNFVGDYVNGDEPPVTPTAQEIDPPAPTWLDWPGRWGASTTGDFKSPVGPAQAGEKWLSPATWADSLSQCWEVSSAWAVGTEAEPLPPPEPKIVATKVGQRVRIAYSFRRWPVAKSQRPVLLVTSVKSSDPRYVPYMRRHRISTRKGIVWQPLGLGKGPYKLFAAAYSRAGRSSETVMVRVRTP